MDDGEGAARQFAVIGFSTYRLNHPTPATDNGER